MNYKLIGNNFIFTPIYTILENRGIDKSLFNLDNEVVIPYSKLDHIDEGIKVLIKNIDKYILIVIDSDCDGMASSASLYRYLKNAFPDIHIDYVLHSEKKHGLSDDLQFKVDKYSLIILPDASSNDFEQHKILKEKGIDILVLDHHECDLGYSENAIVINNQLSNEYHNKSLSGVGIVYKYICALDDFLKLKYSDKVIDLVALGNIADMMNLKSEETRFLVYKGIENINTTLLKAFVEDNNFELENKYNIEKIGWVIAPKINGVLRSGTLEEKEKLFKGLISDDYDFCLEVAKMCRNIKAKQDRNVKSALEKINKTLKFKKIDKCIILDTSKNLEGSYRGLVAQKISDMYGVPTLLYTEKAKGIVGGSFRGSNLSETFRSDLLESGLLIMAQGHENAGGWEIEKDKLTELEKYINEKYKEKEIKIGKVYNVDFDIDAYELEEWIVDEIASYENEFGNGIDVPLIAIKNIDLYGSDISVKKNSIVFNYNNIKFTKKFATKNMKEEMSNISEAKLNVIGKCVLNTYKNLGEIEIVDFEIIN